MQDQVYTREHYEKDNLANIPERYKNVDIELVSQAFKKAVEAIRGTRKGLFIYGTTGVGKTYALYSLTKSNGLRVKNYTKLLDEIYSDLNSKKYYIENITSQKMFAIDDIGTEKHTEFNQDILYMIINEMNINKKRLFISTNLTPEQFEEKYGDRIFSRICEMCEFVELTGPDRRI